MESKTKTDFPPDLLTTLTKAQFGSAARIAEIRPMSDGWFNTVYAIHFADHTPPAVLRIAPPPDMRLLTYEKDMMQKELRVYQTLQKAGTMPIPRLLGYDFERKLIERDYMFIEHFSGQPFDKLMPDLSDEEKASIERQVGEMAAVMHAISNDSFGYFGAGPGSSANPGARLSWPSSPPCWKMASGWGWRSRVPTLKSAQSSKLTRRPSIQSKSRRSSTGICGRSMSLSPGKMAKP